VAHGYATAASFDIHRHAIADAIPNLYAAPNLHAPAHLYALSNTDGYANLHTNQHGHPIADPDTHRRAVSNSDTDPDLYTLPDLHPGSNSHTLSYVNHAADLRTHQWRHAIPNRTIHGYACADSVSHGRAITHPVPNLYRASDLHRLSHANREANLHPISNPNAGSCG
jgi:hypothetical protein